MAMRMKMRVYLMSALLALVVGAATAAALTPLQTDLARAVPADVFVFEHKVQIPEDDFSEEAWGRVGKAVMDSGIIKQSLELLLGELDDSQRSMVEEKINKAQEFFTTVDWESLASMEQVFAMRMDPNHPLAMMTQGMAPPDMIWGLRGDSAEENYESLRQGLEYVADLNGEILTLTSTDAGGVDRTDLSVANLQSFVLLRKDDTIFISMGTGLLGDVLIGLKGDAVGGSLVDDETFKETMALLPAAQIGASYSNLGAFWSYLNGFISRGLEVAETQNPDEGDEIALVKKMVGLAFTELSILDTVANTSRVEGFKFVVDAVVVHGEGAQDTIVYRSFMSERTVNEWAEYIPKEATSFSASSGVDLLVMYDEGMKLFREFAGDDATEVLNDWQAMQDQYEVDVREDLLGWISGEMISYKLPKVGSSENGATLMKVNDEEKARKVVDRLFVTANQLLSSNGQAQITRSASPNLGDEFQVITHPQIMMFGMKFIVGVKDGWLFFGLSEDAVSKSLATARGDHPSIRENEGFAKRSLEIGDGVTMVKYQDMSNMGQELAAAVAMASFFGGMSASQPGTPPQVGKIFNLIGRLSGPLQQINFLDSTVSVAHSHTDYIRTTTVTAYKESVVAP